MVTAEADEPELFVEPVLDPVEPELPPEVLDELAGVVEPEDDEVAADEPEPEPEDEVPFEAVLVSDGSWPLASWTPTNALAPMNIAVAIAATRRRIERTRRRRAWRRWDASAAFGPAPPPQAAAACAARR